MNEALRKRLIGAAAVVVAALVVFPLLFSGDGYRERHLPSNIPEAPALPEVVEIVPEAPQLETTEAVAPPTEPRPIEPMPAPEVVSEEAPAPAPLPDLKLHEDPPVLDQQNVPVAWTLQLASFRDESNAKALRKKLVAAGHKVYSRRIGDLVKVYVGPDVQRTRLEALQTELKSDFGLNGIIVRFTTQ
ncbi:hypothetical protein GCM10011348_02400 [Marinobacterium nitratireducens]|uniref:SPOR domain-containing protein n=1 Tax=Marinobacterium nitratireducens TaxID=518897 RepID=A0A917Z8S7_9GAMM|nr:SPOR domain-containing protein [Marinobacterium nitratireducens]GGO76068.1 hypothetical protein GCM10011348_02400 [Marinobacterium nitratireducens]